MRALYTLFVRLYYAAAWLIAPFNEKAKLWIEGRKRTFKALQRLDPQKPTYWVHCASLGEFEQGRPLIEKLRRENEKCQILVTFFSPSGYEIKKNDPIADVVAYLPNDTRKNARHFIDRVKPTAAIFVKYEYWYNFMHELHQKSIPFYYISVIYRPQQHFFKWYGAWFRKQLQRCTHFYVQNEASKKLLHTIGIQQVTISGDTRFDRVHAIAQQPIHFPFVEQFKADKKLLVCGSTWLEDERVLSELFPQIDAQYKLLIAPHLIDNEHIRKIKALFAHYKTVCYSERETADLSDCDVFIVDTIGLLSKLYKYGEMAYIGGAFATGLHNTLEAAVFGIPLFFGPRYAKFNEAVELVRLGAAVSVRNAAELTAAIVHLIDTPAAYTHACNTCKQFVNNNLGAVQCIALEFRVQSYGL